MSICVSETLSGNVPGTTHLRGAGIGAASWVFVMDTTTTADQASSTACIELGPGSRKHVEWLLKQGWYDGERLVNKGERTDKF